MHMRGTDLKAWRKGLKITQAEAATLLGRSLRMVIMYEKETAPIPDEVAAFVKTGAHAVAEVAPPARTDGRNVPGDTPAPAKGKAKQPEGTPPALAEAMKRDPLYAETSAEAFAMRDELHRRTLKTDKEAMRSCMPLIPLKPRWQSVQPMTNFTKRPMGDPFKVNAAIPSPVAWARGLGPRAVRTASGAVYDYETAAQMRAAPSN